MLHNNLVPTKLKNDGLTYYAFYDSNKPNYIFANYWWKSDPLIVEGKVYTTPEHFFQAQKFPVDSDQYKLIVKAQSADAARREARNLFDDPKNKRFKDAWIDLKKTNLRDRKDYQAMLKVVRARWEQDEQFQNALKNTRNAYIFEDTYRAPPSRQGDLSQNAPDRKWGGGADGLGDNLLGMALMEVRNEKLGIRADLDDLRNQARREREEVNRKLGHAAIGKPLDEIASLLIQPSTHKKVRDKLEKKTHAAKKASPHSKRSDTSNTLSPEIAEKLAKELFDAFTKLEELLKKIDAELDRLIEEKNNPQPESEANRFKHS